MSAASNLTFPPNNLTFPDRPDCFQLGNQSTWATCGPISTSMLEFLNITDAAGYFQAYCLAPPDDSCALGYCPNPDIAGPAVRYSTYVTNICLAIVLLYSPETDDTFFAQILTIYSLIVSAIVAIALNTLTRIHSTFVLLAAASPLTLFLVFHAALASFGVKTRLHKIFGPNYKENDGEVKQRDENVEDKPRIENRKWIRCMLILFAVPVWIVVLVFTTIPHSIWRFQQSACDGQGLNHIKDFLLGPLSLLWEETDSTSRRAIVFIFLVLPLFVWAVGLYLHRGEIWNGKSGTFERMWSVVMDHYPFLKFSVVIWIPNLYWCCCLELDRRFDQEPFQASYGQLLAIFVAVPPLLSVIRLLPRLGTWLKGLTWVQILIGLGRGIIRMFCCVSSQQSHRPPAPRNTSELSMVEKKQTDPEQGSTEDRLGTNQATKRRSMWRNESYGSGEGETESEVIPNLPYEDIQSS